MDIIAATIRQIFEKKGYQFFDGLKPYNLNIFGIRYPDGIDQWSDFICILYRNDRLNWELYQTPATTKSGLSGLRKPVNKKGTGILAPGQYLGAYMLDLHNGKHLALCQRLQPVKVYRDNNLDAVLDLDPANIEAGYFGINIHSPFSNAPNVGGRSVACQVPATVRAWDEILALVKKAAKLYGNSFTYTLFTSEDFADMPAINQPATEPV
jgi:hypothetical protein